MEGKVTMSMGMATFNKVTVRDPEQIIAKADHALYRAKELGKNRLVIYRNGRTGLEEDAQAGADPVVTSSAAAR
jgi:predicted signal transduction protein with EAL and GGDEF domain